MWTSWTFKQKAILTIIAFIIIFFVWAGKEQDTPFPENGSVTYEQLDEIIELANDRTRDSDDILDDIIDKVKEIKEDMKTDWEIKQDINNEEREMFLDEQPF